MHQLGRLRRIAPNVPFDALVSDDIEAYLRSLMNRDIGGIVNPIVSKEAMMQLRWPMHVSDPEARML